MQQVIHRHFALGAGLDSNNVFRPGESLSKPPESYCCIGFAANALPHFGITQPFFGHPFSKQHHIPQQCVGTHYYILLLSMQAVIQLFVGGQRQRFVGYLAKHEVF